MNDALGNALMIEVGDFLAEDEILEQRRPAQPGLQRILIVRDRYALVGGEDPSGRIDADAIKRAVAGIETDLAGCRCPLFRRIDLRRVLPPTMGSRGSSVCPTAGSAAAFPNSDGFALL